MFYSRSLSINLLTPTCHHWDSSGIQVVIDLFHIGLTLHFISRTQTPCYFTPSHRRLLEAETYSRLRSRQPYLPHHMIQTLRTLCGNTRLARWSKFDLLIELLSPIIQKKKVICSINDSNIPGQQPLRILFRLAVAISRSQSGLPS